MRFPSSFFLLCLLLGLTGLGVTGCSTARMALPADLTPASLIVYPVSGRQGWQFSPIRFGPYTLEKLHRGFTTSERLGIFIFEANRARRPFRFEMHRPEGSPVAVEGRTRASWADLNFEGTNWNFQWGLRGETLTTANFTVDGQEWVLALSGDQENDFRLRGVLTDGVQRWEIVPTRRLQNAAWDSESEVGFSFQQNGTTWAAVEVINEGRVFFRADLPAKTRDILAAAAGILLLDLDILR